MKKKKIENMWTVEKLMVLKKIKFDLIPSEFYYLLKLTGIFF